MPVCRILAYDIFVPTWFGVASYATYLWHWLWKNFWVTLTPSTVAALVFASFAGLMAVQVSIECTTPSTITSSGHTRIIFSKLKRRRKKRRRRKNRLTAVYLEQVKGQQQTAELMQALWLERRAQATSFQRLVPLVKNANPVLKCMLKSAEGYIWCVQGVLSKMAIRQS